jgi:hypothetical protein
MSVGDFGTMIQNEVNPLITLTNTRTLASGQSQNGTNNLNGTVYAFWFLVGDAIVGFFYTNVNLSGPGGTNVVFPLNFTNQWINGFITPTNFYSRVGGYNQGVINPQNAIYMSKMVMVI